MTDLSVRDLVVTYGGISAVRSVSFDVPEGSMVAIAGANGAGKSSTVRAIMGIVPATGSVTIGGESVLGKPIHRRVRSGTAFVPEGRGVFGPLTVRENLLMGAHTRTGKTRTDGLDRVLSLFPILAERIDQSGGSLSGGQQQMLAVGRAMMALPSLLILDEPSMGLAPTICTDLFRTLRQIADEGTTVLVSDQNARRVLKVSDYLYVMRQGILVANGPASEFPGPDDVAKHYFGTTPVEGDAVEVAAH
jgi:branched-chain amino acid transport system ATP-binding protein